jgi:hypothetical protein
MVTFCYYYMDVAHYECDEVRRLAADPNARRLTRSALDGCLALGFDPEIIWETLAGVGGKDCLFIKTLDSDKRPGEKLDVYDALVESIQVYLKLKIVQNHAYSPRLLVILSFKRNEFYDRTLR